MDLATFHAIAVLRPHPNRARYLRGDVTYCPLCGFFLPNEWDSHFTPCLARRSLEAWYADVRLASCRQPVTRDEPAQGTPAPGTSAHTDSSHHDP